MILNNAVIELIRDRFEEGSVILEFGSGEGSTQKLSPFYKMISIEEDEQRVISDMFDSTDIMLQLYETPIGMMLMW